MQYSKPVTLVATMLLGASAFAQSAWTASATMKIRPGDAAGTGTSATLEAARNEFEAFHVVLAGGGAGAKAVTVAADPLVGASGNISDVRVYREGMYNVTTISNVQGATGAWPDAMIPAVDEVDNQPRNAFPVDVAANQQQPVFVEYHVPQGAAAGWYTGTVHVTGGIKADIPVKLYVHAFTLPSTSSLPSAYGIGWNDACTAHYGGYSQCGGDAGVQALNNKYTKFALDHRISLSEVVYNGPAQNSDGSYDWATWDAMYGPMLDGSMGGRLIGAKLTSVRYMWNFDQAHYAEWAKHFRQKGWFDRTFDYSCDEPPAGCTWAAINTRTSMVHAADPGFQTLVTTSLAEATQNGVLPGIDLLVPGIVWLDPMPPATNLTASYAPWLASSPQKKMWIYQSCDSDGCNSVGDASTSGWPSHMIDAPASQNRAMEWQAWRQRAAGELYYDTTYAFTKGDAWSSQFYFGGNGDGTLFYPGTPAKIGGTTHVPIASLRVKLIREGMEDYEYLKALADAGDPTMADTEAAGLSPKAYQNMSDAAQIDNARHRIALRIEQLTGQTPPPMGGTGAGGGGQNSGGNGSSGGSGDGTGTGGNGVGGNGVSNGDTGSGGSSSTPTTPSSGGKSGCSMAQGGRPLVTPFTLALAAVALLLVARRRRAQAVRVRR